MANFVHSGLTVGRMCLDSCHRPNAQARPHALLPCLTPPMRSLRSTARLEETRAISTPSGALQCSFLKRRSRIGLTRPVGRPSPDQVQAQSTRTSSIRRKAGISHSRGDPPRSDGISGELFPKVGSSSPICRWTRTGVGGAFYNQGLGTAEQHIKEANTPSAADAANRAGVSATTRCGCNCTPWPNNLGHLFLRCIALPRPCAD